MLKRFEVQGFKSFLHPVTIDFSDVRDYQFNNTCVKDGLLNKIIVYGRNSVGKTNLGLALFDIVSTLTSNNVSSELYNYYLNADSTTDYAQFDYLFSFDNGTLSGSLFRSRRIFPCAPGCVMPTAQTARTMYRFAAAAYPLTVPAITQPRQMTSLSAGTFPLASSSEYAARPVSFASISAYCAALPVFVV